MKKTKIAILGSGFIADIHLESYHRFVPEAEVTAVWSRHPEKTAAFAQKHHIPQTFPNLDTLLASSDCEVVDVCLPNHLHCQAVVAAARSGRHVIIEKPLH